MSESQQQRSARGGRVMGDRKIVRVTVTTLVAAGILVGTIVGVVNEAQAWRQPSGGCTEAWQAPKSKGAAQCRAHGWTVTARLVLDPRHIVKYSTVQQCRFEDGRDRRKRTCMWYGNLQGDKNGATVWYRNPGPKVRQRRAMPVWEATPVLDKGWHWTGKHLVGRGIPAWTIVHWGNGQIDNGPHGPRTGWRWVS